MRLSLIYLLFLLFSLEHGSRADNVNVPYTNYDFPDPNVCTVINDDANKVCFKREMSVFSMVFYVFLAEPFFGAVLQK